MRGQALGEIERRRPADIVRQMAVHLALERRIGLGRGVGLLQLEDERHQRLGDEAAAVDAEMPALVGPGAERIGLLRTVMRCSSTCRRRAARPRARARMKARILSGSFSPGARSTPEETSTPGARVMRSASADVAGIEPAGEHERHAEVEALQEAPVERLAEAAGPRRLARRARVEQQPVGDARRRAGSARGRRALRSAAPSSPAGRSACAPRRRAPASPCRAAAAGRA